MKKDEREIRQYLQKVLSLNPEEGEEIFSLRGAFLGKPLAPPPSDLSEKWELFREKLSELRKHFWEWPPEMVQESLLFLKDQNLPLSPLASQLERVFEKREERNGLLEKGGNPDFLMAFQDLLVGSPQGKISIKRQVEEAMGKGDLKKKIRQTLNLIAREAPGLYKLERKWLNSLRAPGILDKFAGIFILLKSLALWILLFFMAGVLLKILISLFALVF